MKYTWMTRIRARWIALLIGAPLLLSGCDPTIQNTVEDGVINLSTSFLASLLQAVIQVAGDANA